MANAQELSHFLTLEVRDSCLCLHVRRAARALARRYDEALRPVDLTNGQFSLLMALNRREPPRLRDVAEVLAMDRTTLTANLKPLERRGLVATQADGHDRRIRLLALTQAGRDLLSKAVPLWRAQQGREQGSIARSGADDFCADLRALS